MIGRYAVFLRKAIELGKPIFPEAFVIDDATLEEIRGRNPNAKLESLQSIKKANGPWHWSGQYLNDPVDQESVEFKQVWFHPLLLNDTLGRKLEAARCVASLDPAFRLKQRNDFSGIVVSKTTDDNNVYILEAKQIKVNPERLLAEIFRLHSIYHFTVLIVETAQAQLLLLPLLRQEMKRLNVFFMISEISPGSDDNKGARIRGLIPHYAAGRIYHAAGCEDLETQLTEFPRNAHDDIIDALAYQIPHWKVPGGESKPKKVEVEGSWDWWKKQAHKKSMRLGKLFNDFRRK